MISELEILNDTLSYCKIEVSTPEGHHYLTYKYYIVDVNGKLFLDNCLPYELARFKFITTENLDFYVSPFHVVDERLYKTASKAIDSLYRVLKPDAKKDKFRVFMCSSIEEMNILSNMTKYYGYVGGFANMGAKYAVYTYDTPIHKHEFVHMILGKTKGKGFILGEGIASLYGGLSPQVSYADGKKQLKRGYEDSQYNFEQLYTRKIFNARDNTPSYTTAAVVCEYIQRDFGIEKLLEFYYDPNINDKNLLAELSTLKNITEDDLIKKIEKIILSE